MWLSTLLLHQPLPSQDLDPTLIITMAEAIPPKKKVRFQLDEGVEAESIVSNPTSPSTKLVCKKTVRFADEYPSPSNLETPTISSTIVEPPSSPRTIPLDTNTLLDVPLIESASSLSITSSPTTSTSPPPAISPHPAFDLTPTGVTVLQYNEGEKDSSGKVMEPVPDEPCEHCGGKIVRATKGEYYLICQDCQESQ
jgi:hypothetical protein